MAKYNTLVGGGVPLQFFERAVWKGESLNLYLAHFDYHNLWKKYLIDVEDYKWSNDSFDEVGNLMVRLTSRRTVLLPYTASIWVIQTQDPPIATHLNGATSTLFSTFFSWNKAIAMCPLTTFIYHDVISLHPPCKNPRMSSAKTYELRGWKFHDVPKHGYALDGGVESPFRLTRRVGDRYTWTIPFDTQGIDGSEAQPDFVLEHATFSIISPTNMPNANTSNFVASQYRSPVLKYAYTFGADGWYQWFNMIIRYKTLEALHKMKPADRPDRFDSLVTEPQKLDYALGDFEKPAYWTYCDDEIPKLYEEWKTAHCHPEL